MSFQVAFPSYITVAFTHEVLDLKYRSTELEPVDSNTTPVPRILYRIESSTDLQQRYRIFYSSPTIFPKFDPPLEQEHCRACILCMFCS